MILHYEPLQVLTIIQGAISSKAENLPKSPPRTPLLSGWVLTKDFSPWKGASGMISTYGSCASPKHRKKGVQDTTFHFLRMKYLQGRRDLSPWSPRTWLPYRLVVETVQRSLSLLPNVYLPSVPRKNSFKTFLIVTYTSQTYPLLTTNIFPTKSPPVMKMFANENLFSIILFLHWNSIHVLSILILNI